jgi:hypothetical protein
MRILHPIFVILIFMACTDKEQGLSGRYTGNQSSGIGQADSPITIVIDQNGDKITGSVTPPFSNDLVPFQNAKINGTTLQFYRKEGRITFRDWLPPTQPNPLFKAHINRLAAWNRIAVNPVRQTPKEPFA